MRMQLAVVKERAAARTHSMVKFHFKWTQKCNGVQRPLIRLIYMRRCS